MIFFNKRMLLSGILTKGDTEISLLSDVQRQSTHTDLDFRKLYVYCGNSIRSFKNPAEQRSVVNKPR